MIKIDYDVEYNEIITTKNEFCQNLILKIQLLFKTKCFKLVSPKLGFYGIVRILMTLTN